MLAPALPRPLDTEAPPHGARGLGHGLSQWLLTEGESVVDVPARLVARVRLLSGGGKSDAADARAIALAAQPLTALRAVRAEDDTAVLPNAPRRPGVRVATAGLDGNCVGASPPDVPSAPVREAFSNVIPPHSSTTSTGPGSARSALRALIKPGTNKPQRSR